MTQAETLDVLLVEDNPGDARLIEEMLADAESLLSRVDVGAETAGGSTLHHERTLEGGLNVLGERDVDVILLDLGLPSSTGLDTLTTVAQAVEFVPIVVLTGLDDEETGVDAIKNGAQDYLVKDEVTSNLLVRTIRYALERTRQERERARRREQLRALNRLNRIGQDVTHAVINTSTREDLERAVCDRFVEADGYEFAWIGEVDHARGIVTPRVEAGSGDGYLDAVRIPASEDDPQAGPGEAAIRTRNVQVLRNVGGEDAHGDRAARTDADGGSGASAMEEPAMTARDGDGQAEQSATVSDGDGQAAEEWRGEAAARGFRAMAAIPICYEDIVYGVLGLYSSDPSAFSDPETEILARLGDVIGHAITAIERKQALVSDTVLELEFETRSAAADLAGLTSDSGRRISVENVVRADEAIIAYGHVSGIDRDEFREVADTEDAIDAIRVLSSGDDEFEFELVTSSAMELVDAVATHGGRIDSATIVDGSLRFVVEFPQGRDKRQLVELVESNCPGARNLAQRVVERSTTPVSDLHSVFQERLTEKQRTALETAYYAGLFEWPRQSTGQEVAERLGVSPPTFNQHIRAAEAKFFDAMFEE